MTDDAQKEPYRGEPRLPGVAIAIVERRKMEGYLLNTSHDHGADKAAFFCRFGFSSERWQELAAALLEHARANPAVLETTGRYGEEWVVIGPLECPDGRQPIVKSIWQRPLDTGAPRLITAYRYRR